MYDKHLAWLEKQGEKKSIDDLTQQEAMDIAVAKCFEQGEQKPVIEMKTPEESLGIDSDTYNKIVDECIYGEQKPAESIKEYDFHGMKFILKFAKGDIIKDKKSGEVSTIEDFSYDTGLYTHTYGQFPITIQDNYEIIAQKPAWSEEDKNVLEDIEEAIINYWHGDTQDILLDWLKSLKERYTWKPSDEHYELEEFAKIVRSNLTGISKAVQELFEAKYLQLTGNKMYGGFKD